MKKTNSRHALLATVALAAFAACKGCDSCPDLSEPALKFNTVDEAGKPVSLAEPVAFDIQQTGLAAGAQGFSNKDATTASIPSALPAGRYTLTFRAAGKPVGELTDVCTQGGLTGCDAEKAGSAGVPVITVTKTADGATVRLEKNGRCP